MDQSPNLGLPYIAAAQAQKHVTHNEAIRALDAVVQLSVLDRDLAAPPSSPIDGARYVVAGSPTGAWSGHAGKVAAWQDGAWAFFTPLEGWIAWVADEDILVAWNGTAWVNAGGGGAGSLNPAAGALVGVNTTADTTNRLAVKSLASLFDNTGAGHQQKINKAAAGDTASQLYQTSYSGRAEIGLTGDDDFHFKVSPDGASWKEAMRIDRATGVVSLPFTPLGVLPNLLINGDFGLNQRAFAFGALASGVYGVDRWKASGATDLGWVGATQTLTINSGAIQQVIETAAWGDASLASQQVTVSVEGLTNGNLNVAVGSASGTITAGAGRRSVTLTLGAGDTGNLAVTLTPASYPVWFKRAKLEVGAAATAWQARPQTIELLLCRRYFQRFGTVILDYIGLTYLSTATKSNGELRLIGPMRATPTLSVNLVTDFLCVINNVNHNVSAIVRDTSINASGSVFPLEITHASSVQAVGSTGKLQTLFGSGGVVGSLLFSAEL